MTDNDDELAKRRGSKMSVVATGGQQIRPHDEEKPPILGVWLLAQIHHTDPDCAAAIQHVRTRWDLSYTYIHKVERALTSEDSEYRIGFQKLLDEYRELFIGTDQDKLHDFVRATGAAAALVPVSIEYCGQCRREAIPGTGLCSRHGGQWLDDEQRANISTMVHDRLLDVSMRAVRTLVDLMDNATSEKVRHDAAIAVLDRAGQGAELNVKHSGAITTDVKERAAQTIMERLDRIGNNMAEVEAARALPGEDLDEIVDAEVVG